MEQVILAFGGEKNAHRIRDMIETAGLAECLICHSAAEVKRLALRQGINAVICGYKLPDETAQKLAGDLPDTCSVLVIAVQSMLELIEGERIIRLTAPAARNDLLSSVRNLLEQVGVPEGQSASRRPTADLRLIEEAKRRLMQSRGMSEEEAHRFLQKRSMDGGMKMAQTAQMILDGAF